MSVFRTRLRGVDGLPGSLIGGRYGVHRFGLESAQVYSPEMEALIISTNHLKAVHARAERGKRLKRGGGGK